MKRIQDPAIVPKPNALAPWASEEMKKNREASLQATIAAAQSSGGCGKAVQALEGELRANQKKGVAHVPVFMQIESTKNYVDRARKRLSSLEERMKDLQATAVTAKRELESELQ